MPNDKLWEDSGILMPVIFIGHGSPAHAIGENTFSLRWKEISNQIPRPKAIVSISAHWLTEGDTSITAQEFPPTIHDFYGFPDELYRITYPAPGSQELAKLIQSHLNEMDIKFDESWGYDHGTWCVLSHMYPEADIPVLQLSIDYQKDANFHFELGKQLSFLRKKGVLIFCSGNVVHNLRLIRFPESTVFDWALEFEDKVKDLLHKKDFHSLINYHSLGKEVVMAIPTPDHYFPFLYALGLYSESDSISIPIDGIVFGSISMTSILISNKE